MRFDDLLTDTGIWHHVVLVRDHINAEVIFYYDGIEIGTMTGTHTLPVEVK